MLGRARVNFLLVNQVCWLARLAQPTPLSVNTVFGLDKKQQLWCICLLPYIKMWRADYNSACFMYLTGSLTSTALKPAFLNMHESQSPQARPSFVGS